MRGHTKQRTITANGTRRVARYRNASNGWNLDLDALWPMPDSDSKRFRLYYGPSVIDLFLTRGAAFRELRRMLKSWGQFEACPFSGKVRQ